MPYTLMIELILLVLMLVAIFYCHRLDRQLRLLRSGRDSMLEAAQELGVSVQQVRSALSAFKSGAVEKSDQDISAYAGGGSGLSGSFAESEAAFPLTCPAPPLPRLRRRG